MLSKSSIQNKLLGSLHDADFDLLAPQLELVEFSLRDILEHANRPIEHAVFLESGIASIVARSPKEKDIEVGLVGREGFTGTTLALGGRSTPFSTYIQLRGYGYQIPAAHFSAAVRESRSLHNRLLLYVHSLITQAASTALINVQADAQTRLARWLLMVHDRSDGNELHLTHEFMAIMLGVRRPWVTETLHVLEGKGHIRSSRGKVTIVNREGLVSDTLGFYGIAEQEYEAVLGDAQSR